MKYQALILAAAIVGVVSPLYAQRPPAPVAVSVVEHRKVSAAQSFVGTVMPVRKSSIGSAVDGRVIEFPVNEGDRVKAGQALAQLRTDTLKIELAAANAELKLRRDELAELENGSRPEEIEQAEARMKGAQALIDYTHSRYQRTKMLFENGRTVSEEELQEALSAWVRAEQTFLEAKAAHKLAVAGPRVEKIAQAKARVASQAEMVRKLEDQIVKHTIISPFDGYVVAEHTEIGQWVDRGELVAEVVDLSSVDVRVHVSQQYISQVRLGMSCQVNVSGLDDQPFSGVVAMIVPQADLRARAFPVMVRVQNPDDEDGHVLKAGMLAEAALPIGNGEQALLVPKDALVLGGPQPTVYVVTLDAKSAKQGKVHAVTVELGVAEGSLIQVKGKLAAGSKVVVQGNERLQEGAAVVIVQELSPDAAPSSRARFTGE